MGIIRNPYYTKLLLSLFFVGIYSFNFCQETIKDTTLFNRNGRQFYKYVVKPGNTLYSISKVYNISVPEIQEHNPSSKNGLSIGDTLYILSVEKDKQTIENKLEVDGNIIVHKVQKKQTLYAISKIYGISMSDIMTVNPELKDGLEEGQLIKIPVVKLKEKEISPPLVDEEKYIIHEVQEKETLYSLSKLYQVPISDILSLNDGLPEGLKVGSSIILPRKALDKAMPDSSVLKDIYNVAFIMPFFLDLNDTLIAHMKIGEKEKVLPKSLVSIQFYQGCLLALDSLKRQGFKFDIRIYDSAKDSTVVDRLIKEGKLKDVDLIIGPFYLTEFLRVSAYAKENKIHIVCPVPQNNKVLLGNPYVSKVATSRNVMFSNLGRYISILFRTQNIIMVGQNFKANPLSFAFKNSFINSLQKIGDTIDQSNLHEIKWDNGSIDPFMAILKKDIINIIVVPSDDQVYVSELLAKLNTIHKDYIIKVIGLDLWLRYNNIDFEYFENLGVMVPVDGNADFNRKEVQAFVKKYNKKYEIFPEKFVFQGFDVTYFYLNQLSKYGNRIEISLLDVKSRLMYFNFNFFKTGIESGLENNSTILLKHEDFELKEVPVFE